MPWPRPSPNLWRHPALYELECAAFDRGGRLERTLAGLADWAGRDVTDIGCGTGYQLARFARMARSVSGIEPHPNLRAIAERRVRRLDGVRVLDGQAERLPLADHSVDVAHARWAYFFGPGCEPGLAELDRVVRPGGTALVIDNDPTRSTWGRWFSQGFPDVDPDRVADFWASHGWHRVRLDLDWTFDSRADLESVVRIELPRAAADAALSTYDVTRVDYAVNVWLRGY